MTVVFQEVASGLAFPEGPVVLPDGSLLVVEIARGCITRIAPDGRKHALASQAAVRMPWPRPGLRLNFDPCTD